MPGTPERNPSPTLVRMVRTLRFEGGFDPSRLLSSRGQNSPRNEGRPRDLSIRGLRLPRALAGAKLGGAERARRQAAVRGLYSLTNGILAQRTRARRPSRPGAAGALPPSRCRRPFQRACDDAAPATPSAIPESEPVVM